MPTGIGTTTTPAEAQQQAGGAAAAALRYMLHMLHMHRNVRKPMQSKAKVLQMMSVVGICTAGPCMQLLAAQARLPQVPQAHHSSA
jgi:hypothetical protein